MSENEWTKEDLIAATDRMKERNDRAERARIAFGATPWWRMWRRHKAWQEWTASVKAFRPFQDDLQDIINERKTADLSAHRASRRA